MTCKTVSYHTSIWPLQAVDPARLSIPEFILSLTLVTPLNRVVNSIKAQYVIIIVFDCSATHTHDETLETPRHENYFLPPKCAKLTCSNVGSKKIVHIRRAFSHKTLFLLCAVDFRTYFRLWREGLQGKLNPPLPKFQDLRSMYAINSKSSISRRWTDTELNSLLFQIVQKSVTRTCKFF